MKAFVIFAVFFAAMLLAGLVFGYGVGYSYGSGNPFAGILGLLAAAGIVYGLVRLRPKKGETRDIVDLMFGDMDDPRQRNISIRIAIASGIHALVLGPAFSPDPDTLQVVNLMNGLQPEEYKQFAIVLGFLLSLSWVMYECYRFYSIDEFWRRAVMGPLALAGAMVFVTVLIGRVLETSFGTPEIPIHVIYLLYWFSMIFAFFRSANMKG